MLDWLREAERAERTGDRWRALQLVETYAFRADTPAEAKRAAYFLSEELGLYYSLHDRAKRSAARLSRWQHYRPPADPSDATRVAELVATGLPRRRARALAPLAPGPYHVVFYGVTSEVDERAIRDALMHLGYARGESRLVVERVTHIAPEVIAYRLHRSEALKLKVELEVRGAKVRIRRSHVFDSVLSRPQLAT